MDTGTTRWVMVGVDGSEPSLETVGWAAVEAAERGMSLRICHVLRAAGGPDLVTGPDWPDETVRPDELDQPHRPDGVEETDRTGDVTDDQRERGQAVLAVAAERARRTTPGLTIEPVLWSGHPTRALITAAVGAEALVLGSRGGGRLAAALLGSVSEQVAMHGRGPVLVVRGTRRGGPTAVGVDGSPQSQAALGFAFTRAGELGVGVRALHAYSLSVAIPSFGFQPDAGVEQVVGAAGETVDQALSPWTGRYPTVPVTRRVVDDLASTALVE
ncbi:MAG TPA: universal stress protein, partial [Mycobacteriales bacterium]|nr:universal stress protein [Mycobacteriales bacterium]